MTLDFYDLKEEPFGFLPDSRFLYLSSTHRQALSSLLVALQAGRGFVTLVAQRDMGKTTLLFHTLNSLGDRVATVYLFQAPRTPVDLLRAVLTDLGIRQIDETVEGMSCQLRGVLLEAHRVGKRVIVVIDEAQNLDTSILDLVCTLPNLATLGVKLIQFILCGQPLLADKLAAIRPVSSKELGAAAHLEPFSAQETAQYVDHRLRTAGYSRQSPLFTPEAAALVARYSQGTPRAINHLCFEALSTAYRYRREQIEAETVYEAATNLDLALPKTPIQPTLSSTPSLTYKAERGPFLLAPPAVAGQAAGGEPASFGKLSTPGDQPASPRLASRENYLPVSPEVFVLGFPKGVSISSGIPVRALVSRPLPEWTIAAVLILAFTGAVFASYRGQTIYSAGRPTIAASPLSAKDEASSMTAMQISSSPAAIPQQRNAAPDTSAHLHDVKGMDLQSALQALSTRKQRQQQEQAAAGATPLR